MYFCWELTTFCSYLLIGYTKTKEARKNSFRALFINLLGGAAFAAGIIIIGISRNTLELSVLPEPIHLDLVLEDETVVEAIPRIGYIHRDLEKLVEKGIISSIVTLRNGSAESALLCMEWDIVCPLSVLWM
ncbi:proton-conducting transporter membrane subunit [Lacrimispora sp. 38-1]|uniref:proton-conducting transporter transmembrane domain-containing protein n=1 Tax=Lacrimispora sp. 38-1 TaxID=3125778 RepID=UPI003CEBE8B1